MKGKILGSRYQVLEYIAEGGFGKTYLAEDTQLPGKDLCIVKQLAPSFNAPNLLEIARRLFKTEATALHSLGHHPQIPELLAYFEEAEKFYLVQQYIAGQTLDKELIPRQRWSTAQVVELLKDCLSILQFIHDQGVIHRDLKPTNLIRRDLDGKIVLVDFGSVKNILQEQGNIGQFTVAVGTQGYMPIEQARGKPNSTSDLYALGMIAIQALTGVKPLDLEEDEQGEMLWTHLVDHHSELTKILSTMIRYNHLERYPSAQSVLDALNSCGDLVNPIASQIPLQVDNSPQKESILPEDVNALPGVRSIAMMANYPSRQVKQVKPRGSKLRFWKIALMGVVISGGIYLSLQQLVSKPTLDSSPKVTPRANN